MLMQSRMRFAVLTECVRRVAPMYAMWAFILLMFGSFQRMATTDGVDASVVRFDSLLAGSMTAAWVVAMMVTGHMQRREFNQLPVSRRDLWVSRWWLSVLVPGLVAAVGSAGGELITHYPSPNLASTSHVALAVTCCATWGAVSMMMQRTGWLERFKFLDRLPPHSKARRILAITAIVWVLGWVVGGIGLPFVLAPMIVATVDSSAAGTYVLAIVAAAVVLAQYLHQPPLKARPPIARVVRRDASAGPNPAAAPSTSSSVSGVSFIYWREARKGLWTLGIATAAIFGYWTVFESTQPLVDFLRRYWLLPFDTTGSEFPLWFFMLIPILSPQGDDVRREIRRLRTLPFSGRSLSQVLMIRALIGPTMLWIAGLALHVAVLGAAPSQWRLSAVMMLFGVIAVMHATSLALAGRKWAQPAGVFGMMTIGALWTRLFGLSVPSLPAMFGSVLLVLVIALWLSERSIRKRSLLYSRYDGPLAAAQARFS